MNRILVPLLIVALLMLSACNKADEILEPSSDVADTGPIETRMPDEATTNALSDPLADIELRLTPNNPDEDLNEDDLDPTPIPLVALKDYVFDTVTNEALGVSFKYPSHWINIPGENTICYEQIVDPGIIPARIAVTYKPAGDIVVTEDVGMDKLTAYSKVIGKQYTNYNDKRKRGRLKFADNTGFYLVYTGEKDGQQVRGYCAIAYAKVPKNTFYVLHFSCLADDYKNFDSIRKNIVKSMRIL